MMDVGEDVVGRNLSGLALGVFLVLFLGTSLAATVLDYALCRGLDKDGLPLDRTDKFSTEDKAVIFWVFLEGVEKGGRIPL